MMASSHVATLSARPPSVNVSVMRDSASQHRLSALRALGAGSVLPGARREGSVADGAGCSGSAAAGAHRWRYVVCGMLEELILGGRLRRAG
jgi:hypothetical protein